MSWKEFFKEKPKTPLQNARSKLFTEMMMVFIFSIFLGAILNIYFLPPESKQYIRVEDMINVSLAMVGALFLFKLVDVADGAYKLYKLKKGEIKP